MDRSQKTGYFEDHELMGICFEFLDPESSSAPLNLSPNDLNFFLGFINHLVCHVKEVIGMQPYIRHQIGEELPTNPKLKTKGWIQTTPFIHFSSNEGGDSH